MLVRVERVEWFYDGLGGKIIPWTKEHGGTSDDPSAQAFLLHHDGTVVARAPDATLHQASAFARWLSERADVYEKEHPRTRVPFVPAAVVQSGEGEEARWTCPALEEACAQKKPVLLYVGRSERPDPPKGAAKEVKAARKFERSTLDAKAAAEAAQGVVLLRLDRADEGQAAYASTLGVTTAPALVLFVPGAEAGEVLPAAITGAALALRLKKARPAD